MLFDALENPNMRMANRIVMAPMTRCRADQRDAVPSDLMVEYYRQRASAGLIISEGVPVSDRARGYINTPALWNKDQADGWKKVADAVHAAGGRIFAQLWHCGRISHSALHKDGSLPAGVSAAAAKVKTFIPGPDGAVAISPCEPPVALSTAEVKALVQDFGNAARLALLAGFDGVEVHGANGYLFDQFRCPFLNDRSDEYGGSLENRYRLLLEVVDAVAGVFGPMSICVRQSPYGLFNDMQPDPEPLTTYGYIARELEQRGVGFLHLYDQDGNWLCDSANPLLAALRDAYHGSIIACGGFTADSAEALLASGKANLIAFGKAFISNPDLVERMRRGVELTPWDQATFYASGAKGYTDIRRWID